MGRLVAICLSLFVAAQPARAAWMEASTAHFQIYANASPEWIQRFAVKLERFDSSLRARLAIPEAEGGRSNRLTIFILNDRGTLRKMTGSANTLGVYRARAEGTFAFMTRDLDYTGMEAETVLFHEYTHHLMLSGFTAAYPAWFTEGFAEFASTADFSTDGRLGFGKPARFRNVEAYDSKPMPLSVLLDPRARSIKPKEWESVYARGWLLVHYLTFSRQRASQLNTYLELINDGMTSVAAAQKAFGDLPTLEAELDVYRRQRQLPYIETDVSDLEIGEIAVRPLDEGDAAMMPVRIRSAYGVDPKVAIEVVETARRIATRYPQTAFIQASLAEAEYDADDAVRAEAAADRAIAADPGFEKGLIYKGLVAMWRLEKAKSNDAAEWQAARKWIVNANRVDPNRAEPLFHYYQSFGRAAERPTAAAVAGLYRAFELAPQDANLRLSVVHQYLADKRPREARSALIPLAFDAHRTDGTVGYAAKLLALIDAGKTDPDSVAALSRVSTAEENQGEAEMPSDD